MDLCYLRCVAYFVYALFATSAFSAEIVSVDRGFILPKVQVLYSDDDADTVKCEIFADGKTLGRQETFVIAGLAKLTFSVPWAIHLWAESDNLLKKKRINIKCKVTNYLTSSRKAEEDGEESFYVSEPTKLID